MITKPLQPLPCLLTIGKTNGFLPTASATSVRVVLQKVAEENLILHQINVKTAYFHQVCMRYKSIYQREMKDDSLVYKRNVSLWFQTPQAKLDEKV